MNATYLPLRLAEQLSVQHLGGETLVYDERRHRAFCLNSVAAAVWNLCDGTRTTARIAEEATLKLMQPITEELVHLTLAQLGADALLATPPASLPTPAAISRRAAMARIGTGAALLLPVVTALSAPTAAHAYGTGCVDCSSAQPQRQQQQRRKQSSGIDFSSLD